MYTFYINKLGRSTDAFLPTRGRASSRDDKELPTRDRAGSRSGGRDSRDFGREKGEMESYVPVIICIYV